MGLYVLAASTLLQLVAAAVAGMLVWMTVQRYWIAIAIAILLMAVRRTISLYQAVLFQRSVDLLAESVALLISLLMLAGLFALMVREGAQISERGTVRAGKLRPSSSAPGAIAAVLLVLATSAVSYLSFTASRDALTNSVFAANQRTSQLFPEVANTPNPSVSFTERIKLVPDQQWLNLNK